MRLRIKNWSEFQHYKDRCPPWIKLHTRILSSKDWVTASDSERVLAIACMLIASQSMDGSFDWDPEYIQRVAYLKSKPNPDFLIKTGFLEVLQADASEMQAYDSTLQADATKRRGEKNREEKEKEKKKKTLFRNSDVFDPKIFREKLKDWSEDKCKYFYKSALNWSDQDNNMKINWIAAVRNWDNREPEKWKNYQKSIGVPRHQKLTDEQIFGRKVD